MSQATERMKSLGFERLYFRAINSEKYGPVVLVGKSKEGVMWEIDSYYPTLQEATSEAKRFNRLEQSI